MKQPDMTSNKPYLLRALYEWILDNNMVPHIVVDAGRPNVKVPMQYVQDGKIILNIAPQAAQRLYIDNNYITFGARFSGVAMEVYAPINAILAIYARENGAGMVFDPADEDDGGNGAPPPPPTTPTTTPPAAGGSGKPKLTLVK